MPGGTRGGGEPLVAGASADRGELMVQLGFFCYQLRDHADGKGMFYRKTVHLEPCP